MATYAKQAISDARRVISAVETHRIEKTIWGSPAGKKKIAKRLVALLPPHRTYVEPFCGSAAVLFEKEPAEVEVISDANQDIVRAYRSIKRLTKERLERLRKMNWVGDVVTFRKIYDSHPQGDLAKLYRFLYVTHFSYGRMRGRSFSPASQGVKSNTIKRLENFGPRLKKVTIQGGDYEAVIRKYDSPTTAFYLDPPYAGYDADVGESKFDEEKFYRVLKSIKGKFLLTYGVRGKLPGMLKKSGFHIKRIRTPRDIRSMRNVGGPTLLTQLVVTNYSPKDKPVTAPTTEPEEQTKAVWSGAYINDLPDSAFLYIESGGEKDEDGKTVPRTLRHFPVRNDKGELDLAHVRNAIARIPQSKIPGLTEEDLKKLQDKARALLDESREQTEQTDETNTEKASFIKTIPLIKALDPNDERYVLGIVLEPEVVDAQGDIYSAQEIRQAAHKFMEEYGGLGVMHRFRVDDQVKILESYLAPADTTIGSTKVRKGTWLLAVRILSDKLWEQVKDGELTGFSIGGSARHKPEENPPRRAEGEAA